MLPPPAFEQRLPVPRFPDSPPAIVEKAPLPKPVAEWPKVVREGDDWVVTLESGRWFKFDKTWKSEAEVRAYVKGVIESPSLLKEPDPPTAVKPTPTPAVVKPARAQGFQSGGYNPTHNCPNCGQQQWRVHVGTANVPGHSHKCDSCGTIWNH